jgi:hypothetical protein
MGSAIVIYSFSLLCTEPNLAVTYSPCRITLFDVDCLQIDEILEGIPLVLVESRSKLAPERAFEHCLILEQRKVQANLAHRAILVADDFVESLAKLK